jgi:hypothetical protein
MIPCCDQRDSNEPAPTINPVQGAEKATVATEGAAIVTELVELAKRSESIYESREVYKKLTLCDSRHATRYVAAHPDYSSYHVLMALHECLPDVYNSIAPSVKAAILCDELRHANFLDDWSILAPNDSVDGIPAVELMTIGAGAIPYLEPLLSDKRPAFLEGSQEGTINAAYKHRKADFAYRYITIIQQQTYTFDREPTQRDKKIQRLQAQLQAKRR